VLKLCLCLDNDVCELSLGNCCFSLFYNRTGVSDAVRPEAAFVVRRLHQRGIDCYMITGDEVTTAHVSACLLWVLSAFVAVFQRCYLRVKTRFALLCT
jgi:hypothetical protein